MGDTVFEAYGQYYDLLYSDKNYTAETEYIYELLTSHGVREGCLLEFGSGTGKHGCLLADKGYRLHGVELSSEMVARAELGSGFSCEQGDIAVVDLNRTFRAVIALFHVMSYQISNCKLGSVFANARKHLDPGGIFIFDFWYAPAVFSQRPSVRIKRMEAGGVRIVRTAEPSLFLNENRVDVDYTICVENVSSGVTQTICETHPMRYFTLPEIDLLADRYGFERLRAEEFLTGAELSENTWGACVVLRKIMQ